MRDITKWVETRLQKYVWQSATQIIQLAWTKLPRKWLSLAQFYKSCLTQRVTATLGGQKRIRTFSEEYTSPLPERDVILIILCTLPKKLFGC